MITRKIMALATGAMLMASMGVFAQTKAPAATKGAAKAPAASKSKAAPTKTATGTIVSADASKLVISHKVGGKSEDMSFMLDASTAKKGDMTPGAKATVKYRAEGGQNMATSVTAAAAKPAASKAPAATKSKAAPSTKTKLR
jgi:hypothetical protein